MKRIILTLVILSTGAPTARAEPLSATRLYKMCWMEAPDCMLNLKTVYALASAKLLNEPKHVKSAFCEAVAATPGTWSDRSILFNYMHMFDNPVVADQLAWLSAIDAMKLTIDPCSTVHRPY